MSRTARAPRQPQPGGDQEPHGPAWAGVRRVATGIAIAIRLTAAVVCSAVAVFGMAPPAQPGWIAASVTVLVLWTVLFCLITLRHGLSPTLLTVDVLLAVVICASRPRLVPAEALVSVAGTSWVDLIAAAAVFVAQTGLRPAAGLTATAVVAAANELGRPGGGEMPVILVLQGALAAGMMLLLRKSSADADRALASRSAAHIEAATRAAARADELDQQRRLHDTALATLTMVGTGAITAKSPTLRSRAAADLVAIDQLRARPVDDDPGTARLDIALQAVDSAPKPGLPRLDVHLDVPSIELPRHVTSAIAGSVSEALTNVARHAGTDTAFVTARREDNTVVVDITDAGRGFDTRAMSPQRRGYRDSIEGRMRAAGGTARITSQKDSGTRVTLRWSRGR